MKKFWKALGIAALAAVVPVRYKKDEETGVKSFQSLLWKLDIGPKEDNNVEIGLDLMEGLITAPLLDAIESKREEAELFTDDPEEAVMHAYDHPDPDAHVEEMDANQDDFADVDAPAGTEEAEAPAEDTAAEEAAETAPAAEAGEDDYDPYFF